MTDCLWQLQKAAYAALSADSNLNALVSGVFNNVPQGTEYPYVRFDDMRSEDWSTKSSSGIKATLAFDVYSHAYGSKEIMAITHEIRRVMEAAALAMTGCNLVSLKFDSLSSTQLIDGLTWHGRIGFNAMVQVA